MDRAPVRLGHLWRPPENIFENEFSRVYLFPKVHRTFSLTTPSVSWLSHTEDKPNLKPLFRGVLNLEVDQGTNLYTLVDELMRWRELLDNRFKQYQLNNRRAKELYSL